MNCFFGMPQYQFSVEKIKGQGHLTSKTSRNCHDMFTIYLWMAVPAAQASGTNCKLSLIYCQHLICSATKWTAKYHVDTRHRCNYFLVDLSVDANNIRLVLAGDIRPWPWARNLRLVMWCVIFFNSKSSAKDNRPLYNGSYVQKWHGDRLSVGWFFLQITAPASDIRPRSWLWLWP